MRDRDQGSTSVLCKHREASQTDCLILLLLCVELSNQSVWLACVYTIILMIRDRDCNCSLTLTATGFGFGIVWARQQSSQFKFQNKRGYAVVESSMKEQEKVY